MIIIIIIYQFGAVGGPSLTLRAARKFIVTGSDWRRAAVREGRERARGGRAQEIQHRGANVPEIASRVTGTPKFSSGPRPVTDRRNALRESSSRGRTRAARDLRRPVTRHTTAPVNGFVPFSSDFPRSSSLFTPTMRHVPALKKLSNY